MYIIFLFSFVFFYPVFRGETILLSISEKSPQFIGNFREEATFYWVNIGGGQWSFLCMSQTNAGCWLEFHFMVHTLCVHGGVDRY